MPQEAVARLVTTMLNNLRPYKPMMQAITSEFDSMDALERPAEWPFLVEFFMVEGKGFQCMAYCDNDGKWRNARNHFQLYGEIRILE